jgi:N-methylhydantoinase A
MYKVGIDVGGTFTDFVVQEDDGRMSQGKVPSIPGDEARAVINALELAAGALGRSLSEFLPHVAVINFGTTVATNAMLQHRGVPTAMLTTRGFRDILELRRGYKEVLFDIRLQAPEPVVPRRWRLAISERVDVNGQPIEALAEVEVREAARRIREGGIRAVAVCFINSFINAAHEQRAAAILAEECPGVDVHLSSEVLPKIREFERFSTTAVNAFLSPLLKNYIDRLVVELRGHGFVGELLVMQSNGGTIAPDKAGRLACGALLSGPAAGVGAAVRVGEVCGAANVIGVDMGGTSYDVSLVRNSNPETRTDSWFNRQFVGLPVLAIHTIGAGGGSIGWIDSGGALRVGPQSAGARPGPACYGLGGADPTVTDAFIYLGYLNPDFFLGGRMKIRPEVAAETIRARVAEPLGMELDEAAFSIFRIVNNNLSNGIRYVSVAEGHDPRDFALMSFGGAGSVTIGIQARDLGIERVLVPRTASVFCALGELLSDLRVSQIQPVGGLASNLDGAALEMSLERAAAPAQAQLREVPGVESISIERHAEMRYTGQVHELATPMASDLAGEGIAKTVEAFHVLHKSRYAFDARKKPVEVLAIRQDVVGKRQWRMASYPVVENADARGAIKERRSVCFPHGDAFAWLDTPIYDGAMLRPGHRLVGPAIIEEVDTTIVVQPGDSVLLNSYQVYDITIEAGVTHD